MQLAHSNPDTSRVETAASERALAFEMPKNFLPGSHETRASHSSIHRRERRHRKQLYARQRREYIEELEQKLTRANEENLQLQQKIRILRDSGINDVVKAALELDQQIRARLESSLERLG